MTLFTLFISFTFFFMMNVNAQTNIKCGEDYQWTFEDKTLKFTGSGKMRDFYSDNEIPWIKHVNEIESISFDQSSITTIGQKAFQNLSKLKNINFGNIIEIGHAAFYNTGLTQLTISKKIQRINKNAFESNIELTTVTFEQNSELDIIEEKAFKNCLKLTSIKLPESVTTIQNRIFEGCSMLQSVQMGSQVKELGTHLFIKCSSLSSIIINENNQYFTTINNVIFTKDKKELIYYAASLPEKHYDVPFTVETIRKESFTGSKIESITFPSNLKKIEESAFYGSRHLKQLTLPHYLKSIGKTAFAGCRSLTTVIMTSAVEIGDHAFIGCRKLGKVLYIPDEAPTCPTNVFEMTAQLSKVKVNERYPKRDFCGKDLDKSLNAGEVSQNKNEDDVYYYIDPESGTLIVYGNGTMQDFNQTNPAPWQDQKEIIEHIVIKDGVDNIGDEAFKDLSKVDDIVISGTVNDLGRDIFENCDDLYEVEFEGTTPPKSEEDSFKGSNVVGAEVPKNYTGDDFGNKPLIEEKGECGQNNDETVNRVRWLINNKKTINYLW